MLSEALGKSSEVKLNALFSLISLKIRRRLSEYFFPIATHFKDEIVIRNIICIGSEENYLQHLFLKLETFILNFKTFKFVFNFFKLTL